MAVYNQQPKKYLIADGISISSFVGNELNSDIKTIRSFGEEWKKFNQFSTDDLASAGKEYFDLVSEEMMNHKSHVLDVGCGSGRWSYFIADKVRSIECIDPSDAVYIAANLLREKNNVRVTQAATDSIPFDDNTFDFLMCLGVLHHIPDTQKALADIVRKLKPGGYALLYFYYNFENRGTVYRTVFHIADACRKCISRLPARLKRLACDIIAVIVYLPLVSLVRCLRWIAPKGNFWRKIPLSYYANKTFYIMRNDALDRFGTPLEKRFSKADIEKMMLAAGLEEIRFSDEQPYWHCTGKKSLSDAI